MTPRVQPQQSAQDPSGTQAPRRRWVIAFVLALGVLINYFDRVNLSVAKGALEKDFHISNVAFGYLLSAYNWTYAVLQLPSGVLLDRFGVQAIGRISALLWTLACIFGALSPGVRSFLASRLLLGVGEAPTFPANSKAVGHWFPRQERSLATAVFDSAAKFSTAVGTIGIGFALIRFGWRMAFVFTGIGSFLYFVVFYFVYRNPEDDPHLSDGQREFLVQNGAVPAHVPSRLNSSASVVGLRQLLLNRKVFGLSLGFAAYNYCFYLLLTWLPTYFNGALHLPLDRSVVYTSIPWFFATASDLLFGGWLVDWLVKRNGQKESAVRQTVLIGGMVVGLALMGPVFTRTPMVAVWWITIGLCGLAASAPVAWSIPSLIAPNSGVGKVGSIMNFANQVAAIAAPILTGYLIGKNSTDFRKAFIAADCALILGIVGYALLGRIEKIAEPNASRAQSTGVTPK